MLWHEFFRAFRYSRPLSLLLTCASDYFGLQGWLFDLENSPLPLPPSQKLAAQRYTFMPGTDHSLPGPSNSPPRGRSKSQKRVSIAPTVVAPSAAKTQLPATTESRPAASSKQPNEGAGPAARSGRSLSLSRDAAHKAKRPLSQRPAQPLKKKKPADTPSMKSKRPAAATRRNTSADADYTPEQVEFLQSLAQAGRGSQNEAFFSSLLSNFPGRTASGLRRKVERMRADLRKRSTKTRGPAVAAADNPPCSPDFRSVWSPNSLGVLLPAVQRS
jgi:hypothetical protein